MANPFVHFELSTTDVDKAKTFYGTLFGWKLNDVPGPAGTYTMIKVGRGPTGGMMSQLIPDAPSAWMAYVEVDDIYIATRKAETLGAKIMKNVTKVAERGLLSIIADPTGAMLGLWQFTAD